MKTFTKFLTMLAVAALFATGCVNEEPPYKEDPNPEPVGMTGYLSIGNLSMTVVYDETEIRPDDTSDETQAARIASGTRATAPDVDSFIVEILDADNAQVLEMTYAELKEQLKTPMELKVGAYRMEVRSEDTMPGVDWEHPVYGATSDFTITKAQTTSPEEVVCTLQNIKVSVEYSPDLPGFIDCVLISVDPDTDDKDDEIIFSPDPAVISEGFDITEIQKYRSGEKKYRIMAFSELTRFTVSVGDKSYDALNGTTEGISLEPVDKYNVRLTLSDAFFASCQAGDQKVTLRIEDANGGSSEVATTYRLEGLVPVTADDYDLWANTVTLRVVSFTPGTTVQFGLRSSGGEWQPMAGTSQGDDFITATYAPQWVPQTVKEQTVYTQAAGTGIIATHSYDFRAIINGTETTGTFTAGEVQPIPNGDMSGWSMTGGFAFPNAAGESFWSSGNNTMTKTLCTSTDVKFGKSAPAAKLTSTNMLVLAAGNLFTGEFAYKSFTGTVQFGQTYAFTARPSAMKVKYHAHVGTVDKVRTSGDICPYIKKGDPDMARIFVAIVDWNAPHEVVSGMTTTKGAWDPEKGIDNVSEGKILGYGSLWITQSTEGEDMQDAELDIVWYDHETRPAEGNYSLVISCACNAYGDYFTGCSKNVMYVDDFEWVY